MTQSIHQSQRDAMTSCVETRTIKWRAALGAVLFLTTASLIFVGTGNVVAADQVNCANQTTQFAMTVCAGKDRQAADKKLNEIYQKLMAKADEQDRTNLRKAERAWIIYRDAQCAYETSGTEDGSIHSSELSGCLTNKIVARTKELEALATCFEGDLSCKIPR